MSARDAATLLLLTVLSLIAGVCLVAELAAMGAPA